MAKESAPEVAILHPRATPVPRRFQQIAGQFFDTSRASVNGQFPLIATQNFDSVIPGTLVPDVSAFDWLSIQVQIQTGSNFQPVPMMVDHQLWRAQTTQPTQQFQSSSSVYRNQNGIPVNISHGAILTEERGVFIQQLSYEASSTDVESLMQLAGRVDRCWVNSSSTRNRSRGTAVVAFSTPEEAAKAVQMFNGTIFKGRRLQVRLDRDASHSRSRSDAGTMTSGPETQHHQEPVIVDGSNSSLFSRSSSTR